jgi:predicted RNA binding protein YcfA (HicA-like mRNA interferase family)
MWSEYNIKVLKNQGWKEERQRGLSKQANKCRKRKKSSAVGR